MDGRKKLANSLDYDIVVVGGGPAGSSAAFAAAQKGLRVALLERENSIAESVRTSGVTWYKEAREFGIPSEYYNPISKYEFYSPNNFVVKSSQQPQAVVLDIRKTYQYLAKRAAENGTDIYLKTNVHSHLTNSSSSTIASSSDLVRNSTSEKNSSKNKVSVEGVRATCFGEDTLFNAKCVIDASGFYSVVAKSAGIVSKPRRQFGAGAEYEAYVENLDRTSWALMVGSQYTPAGYAWVFPVSDDKARIGVGVGKPQSDADPVKLLNQLIRRRPRPLEKLGKIQPQEFHYGLVPNELAEYPTVYNGLILVGDAAGQANPLVLEGIRYAIQFGLEAGNTAARAVLEDDTTEGNLKSYEKTWRDSISNKIKSAIKVQKRWLALTDTQWDQELEIINDLSADEFIDFIRSDFTLSKFARLAKNHPKIAARQLFHLIKG